MYFQPIRPSLLNRQPSTFILTAGMFLTWGALSQIPCSETAYAAEPTVSSVYRINTYPSSPNFYEVSNGVLYHVLGTPDKRQASFYVGSAPSIFKTGVVYVRDSNHQFYQRDPNGDHSVGYYVPPFEGLDLRLPASIQASDIDSFIQQRYPNSPLIGEGQTFLDAQSKYGVNAQYLASHAILESGWGLSAIAKDKHNLFGYMAYDDDPYGHAAYFSSFKDAIYYQAYFVAKQYLDPKGQWYGGSSTLDGMNVHYASDPYWAEKISGIMNRMHSYNEADYNGKSPLSVNAPRPQGPLSAPIDTTLTKTYPSGTRGITTGSVNFRALPSTSADTYGMVQTGTELVVIGKGTGNWYQVQVNNRTGWVYGDYIKLKDSANQETSNSGTSGANGSPSTPNVGSSNGTFTPGTKGITTDAVNFRAQPSTDAEKYMLLQPGTPLTLLSKSKENWYQVSYNNKTGWVYGDYVQLLNAPQNGQVPGNSTNPSNPSSNSSPSSAVILTVNGVKQAYDPAPTIVNGRTMVPLRALFESLGAKVDWDNNTRTIKASKGNIKIQLQVDSKTALINGKTIQLEVEPQIVNGRTMIPLRFVSESFGAQVSWDGRTRTVSVTNP